MKQSQRPVSIIALILFLTSSLTHAEPCPQDTADASHLFSSAVPVEDVVKRLGDDVLKEPDDPKKARLIDAYFLYDVQKLPNRVNVDVMSPNFTGPGAASQIYTAFYLYDLVDSNHAHTLPAAANSAAGVAAAKGVSTNGINPTNLPMTFDNYLATLSAASRYMTRDSKLLLLSMLGNVLSDGYDHSWPLGGVSESQLLLNARGNGDKGGVCREIHEFLALSAQALGFDYIGTHSGVWEQRGPNGDTGAHVIAQYRDRATGDYYVQNYSQIINTHQKTEPEAIDVSTRVLGPFTGNSFVESKQGHIVQYQPKTARWVRNVIENEAQFDPSGANITLHISNTQQTVGIQVGNDNFKGFFAHSSAEVSDGTYSIDVLGISAQTIHDKFNESGVISQLGWAASAYGGAMMISDPVLSPFSSENGTTDHAFNVFLGGKVSGYARINQVTGKIEFQMNALDLGNLASPGGPAASIPNNSLTATLKWSPPNSPVHGDVSRVFELTPGTWTNIMPDLRTAYDKLNVVIDSRAGHPARAYIVNEGQVFVMEGIEHMSAIGLREKITAAVSTDHLGDFYLVFDASKMVANPADDPMYQSNLAYRATAGWSKKITDNIMVGADVTVKSGKSAYYLFEDKASLTPELGSYDTPQIQGNIWGRVVF